MSGVSLPRPDGAWSLFLLVLRTIGVAEGIAFTFPPVRESAGKVGLFVFHLLPTSVVVVRGRGILQIGFVLIP